MKKEAWVSFKEVVTKFSGNEKDPEYICIWLWWTIVIHRGSCCIREVQSAVEVKSTVEIKSTIEAKKRINIVKNSRLLKL